MSDRDFVGRLADLAGWLEGLINNFVSYGFDPETCTIRWGVTEDGRRPKL
jgi:hypothetical protein